jgi:PilZ domain
MRKPFSKRKYRRFNLSYPVRLRFQDPGVSSEIRAISRNVSIGGLLLETTSTIPKDSQVSFVMTIDGNQVVHPIELIGEGSVVRVEETPGSAVRLALECKNPIEQIENYLF